MTLLLSFIPLLFFIIAIITDCFATLLTFSPIIWMLLIICFNYQAKYFLYDSKASMTVKKIVNILSFVPIIFIILSSFNSFTEGFNLLFGMVYGDEAVEASIFLLLLLFGYIFPILPMCLIYQVRFLIYKKEERKKI